MLYIASPGGTSMVDARWENFVFRFSRTQEDAFLEAFSKNFASRPQSFLLSRKVEGHGLPGSPVARALLFYLHYLLYLLYYSYPSLLLLTLASECAPVHVYTAKEST